VFDMNKGLRSGLVLLVLGIISGTLLAFVNYFTEPVIAILEEQAQYDALKEFYFDVDDPNYASYLLSDYYELSKVEIEDPYVSAIFVVKNKENDEVSLGYLVSANGYSSDAPVAMLIVVDSDMSIRGYKVISHKETSGFGADIVDNDFNVNTITDLSGFDSVAHVTFTSDAIFECFYQVSLRVVADFGGDLID